MECTLQSKPGSLTMHRNEYTPFEFAYLAELLLRGHARLHFKNPAHRRRAYKAAREVREILTAHYRKTTTNHKAQ